MILIVYVYDIVLIGNNLAEIERLKKTLITEFEVRNLGQMCYFIGMKITRSKDGISVSTKIHSWSVD